MLTLEGGSQVADAASSAPWALAAAPAPAPLGPGKEPLVYLSKWKSSVQAKKLATFQCSISVAFIPN